MFILVNGVKYSVASRFCPEAQNTLHSLLCPGHILKGSGLPSASPVP